MSRPSTSSLTAPVGTRGAPYPWQPEFGLGIGEKIGETLDIRALGAAVRSQMLMEPTVRKVPAPVVTVSPITDGATIEVQYTDLSGIPQNFSFNVAN